MKRNRLVGATFALAAALVVLPAAAHHATSTYYLDEPMEKTGNIVEVVWANPHGVIVLQDENGEYWVGEMAAVVDLSSQGLSPEILATGLEIGVVALPSRDGSNRIHINAISVDGEYVYGSPDA